MDNEYLTIIPKMSGYLEKKGRKKMMSCYKKYWFVLEGRLLLYYKSKDEYDAISPCKGSINLGPTCNIKPCSPNAGVFQIESKTTTITLKAESREEQQKWMQALISALNHRNDFKKLSHFRYSVGEISPTSKEAPLKKHASLSNRFNDDFTDGNISVIIEKLQKMGAKSYGIGPKIQKSRSMLERQKQISFSDESIPTSSSFKTDLRFKKPQTVIVENEAEYEQAPFIRRSNSVESGDNSSDGLYERVPSSDSVFVQRVKPDQNNRTSLMTENGMYWSGVNVQKQLGSTEYCYKAIDYNDNDIKQQTGKEPEFSHNEENIYAEAAGNNSQKSGNSIEYAEVSPIEYAEISQYVEIEGARNSSVSSQELNEDKDKKIFGFGKKNKTPKEKPKQKKTKIKKSESFLQRVWHKKSKNQKNQKRMLSSADNIPDAINMTDGEAIRTLCELQDIFRRQNTLLLKQLHQSKHAKQTVVENEEKEDAEMISNEMYDGLREAVTVDDPLQFKDQETTLPLLPPRNAIRTSVVPNHEVPKPQPPLVPPKRKKKMTSASLDDILNGLTEEGENVERNILESQKVDEDVENKEGKVKELIKKFSIGKEEGVELRRKSHNWKLKTNSPAAESNDLDELLDELAKITTAPIMTPGVTTSLIDPEISDREILQMVPIRRRRMSDPDYDIPRPHRSLTNLPKKDENALEATRFFGPILKPSDYESHVTNRPPTPPADYYSNLPSITPDSLEVDGLKSDFSHDELRKISFDSHNYLEYNRASHNNLDFLVENNLYADPRLLFKSKNSFSMYPQGASFHPLEDPDNRFIDSLEP